MPRVCYLPDEKRVDAETGETLLHASLRASIAHAHACGGNARCSTCRVLIIDGLEHCAPPNDKETVLAERLHFTPDIRLACQTTVSGDVELRRLVLDAEDIELTSLLKAGGSPRSVGEEKEVAILFADIRGFTTFAETLLPYDVVHVLNRYFHQVGQAIQRNGGCIDNYMGDGLMALFGVDDSSGATLQAIRAGLDMLDAVERLRPYLQSIYTRSFQIGIGVHYGEVVVGAIGHDETKRVTAIGDAVNLASRIESVNKQAGTEFLISEATYNHAKELIRVGKTIEVTLPGKSGEYTLYEVIGMRE
ncbi:MAG TPA: adenylate/guanylate cyclase domain-containing protein [Blastocatellia bacterium]|nr:adenylate/guanylate cyclase domain-containing protein [Blastocatellia bacterium]